MGRGPSDEFLHFSNFYTWSPPNHFARLAGYFSMELWSLVPEMEWRRMEASMDKDRIKGSAKRAKGKVKEVAGKVLGDSKLKSEGKGDQVKGKVQNTIGGIKDTLRGK